MNKSIKTMIFLLRLSVNKYITIIITTDLNIKYTTYNSHETKFFNYIITEQLTVYLWGAKYRESQETLECLVAGGMLTAQLINHLDAAGSIGHTCSPSTCIEVIFFFSFISPYIYASLHFSLPLQIFPHAFFKVWNRQKYCWNNSCYC